jgi:hypothetical protein
MLKFTGKIVKTNQKSSLRRGKIVYFESSNSLAVRLSDNNILYLTDESLDISKSTILFSSPINDKQVAWTQKKLGKPVNSNDTITKYWFRYKAGMRVYGEIINGKFNVK